MAGIVSKRQQARNEKVLQELVQKVPGNNVCADCAARNPGNFSRCATIWRSALADLSSLSSSLGFMERMLSRRLPHTFPLHLPDANRSRELVLTN